MVDYYFSKLVAAWFWGSNIVLTQTRENVIKVFYKNINLEFLKYNIDYSFAFNIFIQIRDKIQVYSMRK